MSKLKSIYCYLIIIAITFFIFSNTLHNEFVFDDESVIVNNVSIRELSSIPRFFTADEGFHKVIGRYYRPFVSASYTLDYYFWGLDPYGYHLTNLIIHIIACLLLFKILSVLFWKYKYRNLFALLSTLIFAVHPIHTEAVSWISGRTDSLVTLFFFASFLCYLEFTKDLTFDNTENSLKQVASKNYLYLILSLLFYIFGLLTKEMIITMPVIILLYDFVYRKKDAKYARENIAAYILFTAVTIIYLIVRYNLLKDIPDRENYFYFIGQDAETVFLTMVKTIPIYFKLLVVPFPLLYHYNEFIPNAETIIDTAVLWSLIFIALLVFFSIYYYKKDSIITFCILFFFVSLLPVMNIIPTMNLMAERFLYMTSFGLILLICHLCMTGSYKRDFSFLSIGLILIIASLSYLTFLRNIDWKDNNNLYLSAKEVEGSVLLVNIGNIYANNKKYEEASALYKRAIELRYKNVLAHHNLGLAYFLKGKLDSAKTEFKIGISVDSLAPDGYFQLATLYNMQGKKDSAIIMLEKLQTIVPNYRESASLLSKLKSGTPDNGLAPEMLNDSSGNPVQILQNQSYRYYTEKKYEEAIKVLEQLIDLNNDPGVKSGYMNNIAICYSELNNSELEKKYFLEAINLDAKNINALNGMANFYLKSDKPEKAAEYYKMILEINPADENARNKLDSLNLN